MATIAKIILSGDGAVGKTALRRTFMGVNFDGQYLMTIGADFSVKEVRLNNPGKDIMKFQIWDLAGQPRFAEVRSVYYSGIVGAVLVYDITRPDSYENTPKWLMEIKKHSKKGAVPVVLLANKIDLKDKVDYSISREEGLALSEAISKYYWDEEYYEDIPYFETSAKTGENVDAAFLKLGEIILKMKHKWKNQ
ncbi:MAG: GTP-binding protein [Candidatus Thorarchaeota archaeon]